MMIPGANISARDRKKLDLEVVSSSARRQLTRMLRRSVSVSEGEEAHQIELIRKNTAVNIANTVLGKPVYVLELHDWDYAPAEYAWHNAELELVMRRAETPELAEILADLVEAWSLALEDVNGVLEADNCGFRLVREKDNVSVNLLSLEDIPAINEEEGEHQNVRVLVDRMDRAMQDEDWSLVLHTGASIFETVAKQVVTNPNVQNQSLGGWFSLYRNQSKLATPLLDVIEDIFKRRNIEPLAGHGSVSNPSITQEEAIQIRTLTVALVKLERTLAEVQAPSPQVGANAKSGGA